jgi:signal transduction histidine kinase
MAHNLRQIIALGSSSCTHHRAGVGVLLRAAGALGALGMVCAVACCAKRPEAGEHLDRSEEVDPLVDELGRRNAEIERSLYEARLEVAEAQVRITQIYESRVQLASLLSHKLRTQLGIVQGFAEMLEAGIYGAINEDQAEAVEAIQDGSTRMVALIADMLDLARLDAGQLLLSQTPFSLSKSLRELALVMAPRAEDKGLLFVLDVAEDLPDFVIGDQTRVDQILASLVNHALDSTEAGRIHVRVYLSTKDHWAVDVSDTGPGIPVKLREHAFEPFQNTTKTAMTKHSESGIALHIAKRLVDLMDGSVQVRSTLGEGSTFIVTLPLEALTPI